MPLTSVLQTRYIKYVDRFFGGKGWGGGEQPQWSTRANFGSNGPCLQVALLWSCHICCHGLRVASKGSRGEHCIAIVTAALRDVLHCESKKYTTEFLP